LPTRISEEISDFSNKAVAASAPVIRKLIGKLAASSGGISSLDEILDTLSWNELIHTAYFAVPRFRMLAAYAIAHSVGFRPSAAFKSHPDYNLVASWYEDIKPKAEPGRA
jgi:hypothetical protein